VTRVVIEILLGLVAMLQIKRESQMPLEDLQELDSQIKSQLKGVL
jgi:hypothetical protein